MRRTIRQFNNSFSKLKNSFLIIKINSRVEYAKLSNKVQDFESGIDKVDHFVDSVEKSFNSLEKLFKEIEVFLEKN